MAPRRVRQFLREDAGSSTVEFVAIAFFFFVIVFFAVEIALALFWWQTAQKSVEMGARLAIVSGPAIDPPDGTPWLNQKTSGGTYGVACSDASVPCQNFGTLTCSGGTSANCNAANFARIANRMRTIFAVAQDSNISVSYSYIGLGFAGGPTVPAVTVRLSGVPFQTGIVSLLGTFIGNGAPLVTVPDISVTLTGEDLNSAATS